jgi:hypothetical protein
MRVHAFTRLAVFLPLVCVSVSCGPTASRPSPQPAPSCSAAAGGGSNRTQTPTLLTTLKDRYEEAWLASPAVADLDKDGTQEIVIARGSKVIAWQPDGSIKWSASAGDGRVWASPIVGDFRGDDKLEVVVAGRGQIFMFDAAGMPVSGFPVMWRDEIRSIAAGDLDGDRALEIVAVTTRNLTGTANGAEQHDIIQAFKADGSVVAGFPPNTTGTSGCDDRCYVYNGYDQNIALGPLDTEGGFDIFATQDNAYLSWHKGNGVAFDAASVFRNRTKVLGVRMLLDYDEAKQGFSSSEDTSLQAHFTNSAPAIADIDGDGTNELVVLSSVQNTAQTDRFKGVALWVLRTDGTRHPAWVQPFHVPQYVAGLWDFDGTNVVGATNQVTVAEINPSSAGKELVFAGFDGKIHAVSAGRTELWNYTYTGSDRVLTGGVVIADLSGDGSPEIVFNTYSPDENQSHLFVLDAGGNEQAKIALPKRGAMPVPAIADVDGNGTLEIVVSLKDGEDRMRSALVYTVPGSSPNCLLWSTGRGNLLRNGYVPSSN